MVGRTSHRSTFAWLVLPNTAITKHRIRPLNVLIQQQNSKIKYQDQAKLRPTINPQALLAQRVIPTKRCRLVTLQYITVFITVLSRRKLNYTSLICGILVLPILHTASIRHNGGVNAGPSTQASVDRHTPKLIQQVIIS